MSAVYRTVYYERGGKSGLFVVFYLLYNVMFDQL